MAWESFRAVFESIWPCTVDAGGRGRSSWDAVLMLKVLVYGKLQRNLSAAQLEEHCLLNLRVKRILDSGIGRYPDEKTIHKYRSVLAASGRWVVVFAQLFSVFYPWIWNFLRVEFKLQKSLK